MVRRDRGKMSKLDTSLDETVSTLRSRSVPGVSINHPAIEIFGRALEYRTYHFFNKSQEHDETVSRRMS